MLRTELNLTPSFQGRFSPEMFKSVYETSGQEMGKTAKKFRAGKNIHDQFAIKYVTEPARDSYGRQISKTDTFLEVKNTKKKNPPIRMIIGQGKLPLDENLLAKITQKMNFLDNLRMKNKRG